MLNADLYELTNTGSGTATFFQDSNKAGTFTTSSSAAAISYTTATNGRVAVTTGSSSSQVLYLFNTGAGFGIDEAPASGYPGLVQYELQVRASVSLPPFPIGVFGSGTRTMPVAATVSSGMFDFTLFSGGTDLTGFGGSYVTVIDSSTPSGTLTSDQAGSFGSQEDVTGRQVDTSSITSTTPLDVTYVITDTRAASIPATSATTPAVLILQQ
jgi:hypothetical protein